MAAIWNHCSQGSATVWVGGLFFATHDAHASFRSMAQHEYGPGGGLAAVQSLQKNKPHINWTFSMLRGNKPCRRCIGIASAAAFQKEMMEQK